VRLDFRNVPVGRVIRGAGKRIPEAASFYDMAPQSDGLCVAMA